MFIKGWWIKKGRITLKRWVYMGCCYSIVINPLIFYFILNKRQIFVSHQCVSNDICRDRNSKCSSTTIYVSNYFSLLLIFLYFYETLRVDLLCSFLLLFGNFFFYYLISIPPTVLSFLNSSIHFSLYPLFVFLWKGRILLLPSMYC